MKGFSPYGPHAQKRPVTIAIGYWDVYNKMSESVELYFNGAFMTVPEKEETMRILQEGDREEILRYVKKEPEMNLFLIGDIENFGVNSETVNFYLHEERDRWDFLILRFHQFFIIYSQYEDYNAEEAIAFLRRQTPDCISGKTVLLERIAPAFPQWTLDSTCMSRCNCPEGGLLQPEGLEIRRLNQEDVAEAFDLLSDIEEFAKTYKKEERDEQIREMGE